MVKRAPDIESKIKAAVNDNLQSRGYTQAKPPSGPDFYVTYYGRTMQGDWVSTWDGAPPGFDSVPVVAYPEYDRTQLRNHRYEDVAIVFYDARTAKPVWTGTIASVLGPDKVSGQKFAQLLDDLFKKLPVRAT